MKFLVGFVVVALCLQLAAAGTNVQLANRKSFVDTAPNSEWKFYSFQMEKPSSFVITVHPLCHHTDPLDVYLKLGEEPCDNSFDYQVDINESGHYAKVVSPKNRTTGPWFVGVRGSTGLRAPCEISVKAEWGPKICSVPAKGVLSFCENVDYPVVNTELAESGSMHMNDAFAKFMFESKVGGRSERCQQALKAFVCANSFRRCDQDGYALEPCKGMCSSFADVCGLDATAKCDHPNHFDPEKPGCNLDTYGAWPQCTSIPLTITYAAKKLSNGMPMEGRVSPGTFDYFSFAMDSDVSSYILKVEPHDCEEEDPLNVKVRYSKPSDMEDYDIEITDKNDEGAYLTIATPSADSTEKFYVTVAGNPDMEQQCSFGIKVYYGAGISKRLSNDSFCSDVIDYPVVYEDLAWKQGMEVKNSFLAYQFNQIETDDELCKRQSKRFLCAQGYLKTNQFGLASKPCQSMCKDYANTCGVNPYDKYEQYSMQFPGCHANGVYSEDDATCAKGKLPPKAEKGDSNLVEEEIDNKCADADILTEVRAAIAAQAKAQ